MALIRPITAHESSYNGATHQVSIDYKDLQGSTSADNTATTFNIPLGVSVAGDESSIRFCGGDLKSAFTNKLGTITSMTINLGRTGALTNYGNVLQVAKSHASKIKLVKGTSDIVASSANIVLTVNGAGAGIAHSTMGQGSFVAYFSIHNTAGKDF